MKKGISILCVLCALLSITSCSSTEDKGTNTNTNSGQSSYVSEGAEQVSSTPIESANENTCPYTINPDDPYTSDYLKKNDEILKKESLSSKEILIEKQTAPEELYDKYLMYFENPLLSRRNPGIIDFEDEFGVECLRKINDGRIYIVYKTSDGNTFFAFFTPIGEEWKALCTVLSNKVLYAKDFERIKKNVKISEVIKIDPVTTAYMGQFENPRFFNPHLEECRTMHLLKDGLIMISYKKQGDDYVVLEKKYYKDFKFTLNYEHIAICYDFTILPQDYPQ